MTINNVEYISKIIPDWYNIDMSRFNNFSNTFPDFEIASNKNFMFMGFMQVGDIKHPSYLGWNICHYVPITMLGLSPKPGSKRLEFISDTQFNDAAPVIDGVKSVAWHWDQAVDGTNPITGLPETADQAAARIAEHYVPIFADTGVQYSIINFEFWVNSRNLDAFYKTLSTLIKRLQILHPNKKFGCYDQGLYTAPFNNFTNDQWVEHYTRPVANNAFHPAWVFADIDLNFGFGYANSNVNPAEQMYYKFQVHEGARNLDKYFAMQQGRKRETLTFGWESQEPGIGGTLDLYRKIPDTGNIIHSISRHPKTYVDFYNDGMLHSSVLDGYMNWGEVGISTYDKRFYDVMEGRRPSPEGAFYPDRQRLQSKAFQLGMWHSGRPKVKAIIEDSNTEWRVPDAIEYNGITLQGKYLYPSYTRPDPRTTVIGHPIVRVKKHSNGREGIITCVFPLNPEIRNVTNIKIIDTDFKCTIQIVGGKAELIYVN